MTTTNSPLPAPTWMQDTPPLALMGQTVPPGPLYSDQGIVTWSPRHEVPLTFEGAIGLLDAHSYWSVAQRFRELQSVDSSFWELAEGSVAAFTSMITKAGWRPPTHIGLTEKGAISASWRNEPLESSPDNVAYDGSVVMVFPSDDSLYEITAMYGKPSAESEWMQVVGNLEAKKAAGLLDQILHGFHT